MADRLGRVYLVALLLHHDTGSDGGQNFPASMKWPTYPFNLHTFTLRSGREWQSDSTDIALQNTGIIGERDQYP